MSLDNARIFAITQSAIALILIIGSGAIIILEPTRADAAVGIVGLVVGYYFREATGAQQAQRQFDAVAQSQKPSNGKG